MAKTEHFNELTEAQAERLAILSEECAEVIQIVGKILRHGYSSTNKGALPRNNRELLEIELGHVLHAVAMMENRHDIDGTKMRFWVRRKAERIVKYLHHQGAA
jgi:hypothetical protein